MRAAVEGGNTYEALLQVKTATASLSLFNIIFCDVCEYCLIYAWRGWRGDTKEKRLEFIIIYAEIMQYIF